MAVYDPDQWRDFFVMVGGGVAALTGLVFVALTLHLDAITKDATHRYRAIGTLAGFTAAFMICAVALMGGQNHQAFGTEWLSIAAIAGVIYVNGYVQAVRTGGSRAALRVKRVILGIACYTVEMIGAALLIGDQRAGLYVASLAMLTNIALLISGAWLLIVGVRRPDPARALE